MLPNSFVGIHDSSIDGNEVAGHTKLSWLVVDLFLVTGPTEFAGPIHPGEACLRVAARTRASISVNVCRVRILAMLLMAGRTTSQRALGMMVLVAGGAGSLHPLPIIPTVAIDASEICMLVMIQRKSANSFGISNIHS